MSVADRLAEVRQRISDAAKRSGRSSEDIQLVAVSKKQSLEKLLSSLAAGQVQFGENYVQELVVRQKDLHGEDVRWHFIGSLQRNKVKQVVGHVDLIHSVDRSSLVSALQAAAEQKDVLQKILLQLNIGNEPSKSGFLDDELTAAVDIVLQQKNLVLCGVMSFPPLEADVGKARQAFARTRQLFEQVRAQVPSCQVLSMGTTHDFELAIQEGSTLVRVGTAIFGERSAPA